MRPGPTPLLFSRVLRLALGVLALGAGRGALAATPEPAELGRPVLQNHPPGEHLRHITSHTVTQDAAGNIIFGNGGDLLFYDGFAWNYFALPTESAGVRQFATAPDGTIYLGGASVLGYLRGTGRNLKFVSLADRLPPAARNIEEIEHAAALGDAVCFSDEEKILIWRNERFTVIPYATPVTSHGARFHRLGDTLFVTAIGHPLARLAGDRVEPVVDDPVFRENQIAGLARGTQAGTFVLLTAERGFFEVDARGRVTRREVDANRWLAGKRIFRALQLADGSWAVDFSAASGDGGMRFAADGRYLGPLDMSIGIHAKSLRDLFTDREGGLWIGMDTGSTRVEWPSVVSVFDVVNGLGQGAVADVARHDGALYAATTEGVFRLAPLDEAGRGAHFERVLNFPGFALASHPGGLLVLGSTELLVSSPAGFAPIARVPAGGGTLLRSRRDPARVWVGTAHGVHAVRFTAQGWRDEGEVPGCDENCRGMSEATDGSVWVATNERGFFRLTWNATDETRSGAPRVERFGGGAGLPERFARGNVTEWGGGLVFTVDAAAQPFRFDPARRQFDPIEDGAALAAEPGGGGWTAAGGGEAERAAALWLASREAIFRIPPGGGAPERVPHLALAAAGAVLAMREEPGAAGSVLWLCGVRGLVRVEVPRTFAPAGPLAVRLEATGVEEGERLIPEHAPITFRYLAPRYRPGSAVVYQTRLGGRDGEWSAWGPARERFFPHLPSGNYRFEVRARDADGVVSAPAMLGFVVAAPWWFTPWALLGYAGAGAGLLAGTVRIRTRALRQRAARLERVVAERTTELAEKNRELTRLHRLEFDEKTAARLAEEKARLEVLRYQLNPHFLFNTLASISASLPVGGSAARAMVERLAEFCRLTLHRDGEQDWTTLGAELRLLRTYLDIEKSRWGELLDLEITSDDALGGEQLPHFLLLPLVENALKYGRATSPDRVGLRLTARRAAEGALELEVANTGEWIEPTAQKSVASLGIGLDNLRERLVRYYPRAHRLDIRHADGWVTVTLQIRRRPAE